MGSAFWQNETFELRIVEDFRSKNIRNADEIMDAIKEYRIEISEQLDELEHVRPITPEIEKQIAILIRQDQYLEVLQNKQKFELAEIFLKDDNTENNCIVPDVFQWYQPTEE